LKKSDRKSLQDPSFYNKKYILPWARKLVTQTFFSWHLRWI